MDFLKHREGDMVFYQVFLISPLQVYSSFNVEIRKRLREFEEIRKSCECLKK